MKKRILLTSLLALSIIGCTSPILNNTSQYSDLDKEYSQFKTEALTQSYLKKKMDKWLSDSKYSKNLVREIEYAKFKHPTLLKDIVALQPTMFNSITSNTGVAQKRSEPSFESYIENINPFPSNVTATSATAITSTGFTANWNSVSSATGYKLYIDETPITLGNVTTYNVTGLVDGSSHSYYVRATNSAGESSVSNTINVTLLSAAPIATSATAITSSGFTANWNAVTSATGYKLYIDGTPITLGKVTTSNVTGLVDASSHSYYLKATNSAGESSSSNTINVTLPSALPSAPTANSATSITSTSFTANWTAITGATGYKLYIDGTPITLGLVTTYNVTSLVDGSSHSYYVKAINSAGESSVSNTINLTLLSAAPVATSATGITSTGFTANWNSVNGATGYKLYIDGTPITLGLVTTYNVTGLLYASSHSYYVKATNSAGESSVSNTINLSTLSVIDEFKVSSYTGGSKNLPSIAMASDGKYVITWGSMFQDGSIFSIYAQRYNADGTPNGSEFKVNTYSNDEQSNPSVAMSDDGKFVITWYSRYQDGSEYGIYAQRYNADGTANGSEFKVNTYTTNMQIYSSAVMANDGKFVITWISYNQVGTSSWSLYAQKYNANGTPNGSEFKIVTSNAYDESNNSIAMTSDGKFVITWDSYRDGGEYGIYAKRYNADGTANGSEFRVNTYTTNAQQYPSIAMSDDGKFVITWSGYGTNDTNGIFAQKYNADGTPNGSEFKVNTYTQGNQSRPSIAMTDDDRFVINWFGEGQGDSIGIFAQKYNTDGSVNGTEFRVNTYTTNAQQYPSIAMDGNGNFVSTWDGSGNGDANGIFAKRFDSNGNVL